MLFNKLKEEAINNLKMKTLRYIFKRRDMYRENRIVNFLLKWKNKIQYLSDYCSLQVVGYVITPSRVPFFSRIFWLVTIIASCVCSGMVLLGALSLYTSGAVSYSVDTDYLEFDTPFPALTICEYITESVADTKHISKYLAEKNLAPNLLAFTTDVSYWNKKFCSSCLTCKMGYSCIEDFLPLVNDIRRKCTDLLRTCFWNNKPFPCCERFRPIATEYGTCFVFNSRLTGNETIHTVNRKTGLPTLEFEAMEEVMIRVHSPDDMLSVATEKVLSRCDLLPLITYLDIMLSVEQTINDVSVQPLAPSSRDCLFQNERPAFAHHWPFKQYSYSTCLLYCRGITQAEACNCTHHFIPKIANIPHCDFDGLICLNKHKDKLGIGKCSCPMSCDDVMYKIVQVTCPREVVKNHNHDHHGSIGRLRLANLPSLRVRRQAIRELLGLVVDIGGVIGVFFGASLLSFIEIFYILFIRQYR